VTTTPRSSSQHPLVDREHDHHGTRAESPFAPIAITGGVLADETMQL
jgi:hypothetical protein